MRGLIINYRSQLFASIVIIAAKFINIEIIDHWLLFTTANYYCDRN